MFKKFLMLGAAIIMLLGLVACENQIPYNAVIYDDTEKCMDEEFLTENITRGAYFEGINTDDNSYPKSVTRLIKSREELGAIFAEFPTEIDFDNTMICLYIFTCHYMGRAYEISKITVDNQILKIDIKSVRPKRGAFGDATKEMQRCLVIKMDKLDVTSVEFTEK